MNSLAKIALVSSAFIGAQIASAPAMAQTAPNGVYSGTVAVSKGLSFNCVLTLDVDASSGTVEVSLNPPDAFCAALSFTGNPYSYTYTSGGTIGSFTVHDVYVNTITAGDCAGDITATWNGSSFDISTVLPTATPGTPDCTIDGAAS